MFVAIKKENFKPFLLLLLLRTSSSVIQIIELKFDFASICPHQLTTSVNLIDLKKVDIHLESLARFNSTSIIDNRFKLINVLIECQHLKDPSISFNQFSNDAILLMFRCLFPSSFRRKFFSPR